MSLRIGVIVGDEIFRRGLVSIFRDDPAIDVVVETGSGPIDHEGLDVAVVSWSNLGHVELPCPVVVFTPNGRREPLPTTPTSTSRPSSPATASRWRWWSQRFVPPPQACGSMPPLPRRLRRRCSMSGGSRYWPCLPRGPTHGRSLKSSATRSGP